MTDIVLGAITNYDFSKIKYWVNSLDRSGFTGLKIVLCYDIDYSVANELEQRGYIVYGFERDNAGNRFRYYKKNYNICLERFLAIPTILRTLPDQGQYRYLFLTDVKDVIFQTNPSEYLEKNIGDRQLNVACESLLYRDEPWGRNNITLSFGEVFADRLLDRPIYNAGTISGRFGPLLDLCDNIYLLTGRSPETVPGGGGPDQAALNILLNMEPYKSITRFAMSEDGYAAQLGTTADPAKIQQFRPLLLEAEPIMKDGLVCTSQGHPFAIVHQYDRVPQWKSIIENKYA